MQSLFDLVYFYNHTNLFYHIIIKLVNGWGVYIRILYFLISHCGMNVNVIRQRQ